MTIRNDSLERFAELARRSDAELDLVEGALAVAEAFGGPVDVEACLEQLAALGAGAANALGPSTGAARTAQLVDFLCRDQGFAGSRDDYYAPENSFLPRVLARRRGIPISLAIVYIEVGRRAGVPLVGVGFPGHFLVRSREGLLVDAFEGRLLQPADCEPLLRTVAGGEAVLAPEHFATASVRDVLSRMLQNLKGIWLQRDDAERALACCERLLLLHPDRPRELRDRGLLYARLECHTAALADLERYLALARNPGPERALGQLIASLRERVRHVH